MKKWLPNIPMFVLCSTLAAWLAATLIASIYCYSHAIVKNDGKPDLIFSIFWAVKISIVWLVVVPFSYITITTNIREHTGLQRYWWLVLWGVLTVLAAFAVQLLIWSPVKLSNLPYLAYLYLPKAVIAYVALCVVWQYIEVKTQHNLSIEQQSMKTSTKIIVSSGQSESLISINDIHYLNASGNYVEFHMAEKAYLKRTTMKAIMEKLAEENFVRIHRKHIVNLNAIDKIQNLGGDQPQILLKSGTFLPIGRQYKAALSQFKY